MHMARDHDAGGQSEPHAARMGELLRGRRRQQGVSGAQCLRGGAVAPVVAPQAQSQAGREPGLLTSYGYAAYVANHGTPRMRSRGAVAFPRVLSLRLRSQLGMSLASIPNMRIRIKNSWD
jgi:hypothetical protein